MHNFSLNLVICSVTLIYCLQFSAAKPGSNETDLMALLDVQAKVTDDPLGVMTSWNDTLYFCEWSGVTCDRMHQRVTVLDLHSSKLKANPADIEPDQAALLEIKSKITDDPLGVTSSWNNTRHFCKWHGIICTNNMVTTLDLQSSKLTGTISPSLGNLSNLQTLNLQNNTFGGVLPPEIGRLRRLKYLVISNNSIGGEIPANISACSSLVELHFLGNKLVGKIPDELGSLSHLQYISLSINSFTGHIPSIGNLSALSYLYISETHVTGTIPDTLGKLKNLVVLALGVNQLSGIVPPSIYNLTSLTTLSLDTNYLEGDLPSDLGTTLPNLQNFFMAINQFTGPIPASLSNCSNLEILELAWNNLHGEVPLLHKLHRLTQLNLQNNSLGIGKLGANDLNFISSLANATMLQVLIIDQNNLGGRIPIKICNMSFGNNTIVGELPDCLDNLQNLQYLDVRISP